MNMNMGICIEIVQVNNLKQNSNKQIAFAFNGQFIVVINANDVNCFNKVMSK